MALKRTPPEKWTPHISQVLARVEGTNTYVYLGSTRLATARSAISNLILSHPSLITQFAAAGLRPYNEKTDKGKLRCTHPGCTAPLYRVEGSTQNGRADHRIREHLSAKRVADHSDGCHFKNAASKSKAGDTLKQNLLDARPVLVSINKINCGYHGTPDCSTLDEAWYATTGRHEYTGEADYHTESVSSAQDVVDLARRAESIYGDDALNLLYFQRDRMITPYRDFWQALFDRPGFTAQGVAKKTLGELLARGKKTALFSSRVQLATHLIEFEGVRYDARTQTLIGHSFDLSQNGLDKITRVIHFPAAPDLEKITPLLGKRVLFLGAPGLEMPGSTAYGRHDWLRHIESVSRGGHSNPATPVHAVIKYIAGADYMAQFAAVPKHFSYDLRPSEARRPVFHP